VKKYCHVIGALLLLAAAAGCHRDAATPTLWLEQPTGQALAGVQRVVFATPQVGWVVGGYRTAPAAGTNAFGSLLRTTDGGSTWAAVDLAPTKTANGFRSFYPVNEQLVYGVADDLALSLVPGARSRFVYKSPDGGQNWQQLPSTGFFDGDLAFPAAEVGVAAYSAALNRTTDGGNTWQPVWDGTQLRSWVSQVQFPTATTGYATGNCVLKTTDQGQTWQALPWTHGLINQMAFVDANVGFAQTISGIICDPGPCTGPVVPSALYRTQDGGQTWQLLQSPADGYYAFVSAQEIYRAGKTIEHTRDAGQTWQTEYTLPSAGSNSPSFFVSISFPTASAGYAVTNDGLVVKRQRP
jgi:photosystem II stability/assembly factor-like uncharacterized protein